MESLNDKDVRVLRRRQSQGIAICSVDHHWLVNRIPTTGQILLLQCPTDFAADSDKIDTFSIRDLLNVWVRDRGCRLDNHTAVMVASQPAGTMMAKALAMGESNFVGR